MNARRLVRRVRDPAGEEQRRRLGHAEHEEAERLEARLELGERGRLAAARPAGEHHLVHRRQRRHARAAAPDVGESRLVLGQLLLLLAQQRQHGERGGERGGGSAVAATTATVEEAIS